MGAGLKSAGSLRVGISAPPSPEVTGVEGGGGRRRRETTGFYTYNKTKLWSDVRGTRWSGKGLHDQM